jgi:hypothetical protein
MDSQPDDLTQETGQQIVAGHAPLTCGQALKQGFSLARRGRRAVWVLFLVNLGLAALAALPIYHGILRSTGGSLMSEDLARGFSPEWLTDFAFNYPSQLESFATIIAVVGVLAIPVNSLLAGGVVGYLRTLETPFSLANFFRDVARYGWRLLRLMLLGLIFYWLVFRFLHQSLGQFLEERILDWRDERVVFLIRLGAGLLVLLGLAFVNLVMDFARLKLVMEDRTSAAGAVLSSLGFCLRRFRQAAVVYALPGLLGLVLLGIYWLVVRWSVVYGVGTEGVAAPYREPLLVAFLFIGQQLVMFGRYWLRVAAWASEWSLYSAARPAPPPEEPGARG